MSRVESSTDIINTIMDEVESNPQSTPLSLSVIDRRQFLKLTGISAGGLILALHTLPKSGQAVAATGDAVFEPNGFINISTQGPIIIYAKAPEIGQGIKTSFPMIIAEELDANWADVEVRQSPINEKVYGIQFAGGSRNIALGWDQHRQAGAVARSMLVSAAAREWGVSEKECRTANSSVMHTKSGKTLAYTDLAEQAAKMPVPDAESVRLKKRSEYTLLGTQVSGVDNPKLVTGQALFGIDQSVPDMHYASYSKCPATGGTVKSFNVDEIRQIPGVKDVFILEGNGKPTELMPGVAIVTDSTWSAFTAKKQLKIQWDESNAAKDSWSNAISHANEIADKTGDEIIQSSGDAGSALKEAAHTRTSFYTYPFVSHAPLEPQNCTAWYRDGHCELWAPTQTPQRGLKVVARLLSLAEDKVTVHQTRLGGGFGRRLINDYMCEAAAISKQTGLPVKLQWTREDDMGHDFYRVGGFHSLKGGVDSNGKLIAWQDHFVTFTENGEAPVVGGNMGMNEFPVSQVEHFELSQSMLPLKTPCGPWRAPRSNTLAFAIQCFINELAEAGNRDHLEFLLEIMGEPREIKQSRGAILHTGRAAGVIKLAAEKAGWGKPLAEGRGLGLAYHFSHHGHFAEVAEVSVDKNKKLTVHHITVAGDVGLIVNPSAARNQVEGSVIDGLSTMLGQQLSIENGRIQESNFHQYPLLRMVNAPKVSIHFVDSDYSPTGLGEPALPPLAPAIVNAIHAATGERVYELPLSKAGYTV